MILIVCRKRRYPNVIFASRALITQGCVQCLCSLSYDLFTKLLDKPFINISICFSSTVGGLVLRFTWTIYIL